jgi:negative regulator of sigma E activity
MKKTGWGAIGIAAYVLVRFAAVAMKHPDWRADDWVEFLGFTLVAAVVVLGLIWLIQKARAPKALATMEVPAISNASEMQLGVSANPVSLADNIPPLTAPRSSAIDTVKLSTDHRECSHCGVKFDSDAKFCCECGSTVA